MIQPACTPAVPTIQVVLTHHVHNTVHRVSKYTRRGPWLQGMCVALAVCGGCVILQFFKALSSSMLHCAMSLYIMCVCIYVRTVGNVWIMFPGEGKGLVLTRSLFQNSTENALGRLKDLCQEPV